MAYADRVNVEVVPVTTPADVSGKDEIAQLAATFNTMLVKAQSSIEAYNAMRLRMAEMARVAGEIGQGDLASNVEVLSERDQFARGSQACRATCATSPRPRRPSARATSR
jgi:methyl-accepting chemotaxis protein